MSIESIELWQRRARPTPTDRDFDVALGVHLEEICEMFEVLTVRDGVADASYTVWVKLKRLAHCLKTGEMSAYINPGERKAFLDSLADQVVTSVGVGHCASMKTSEAIRRVDRSNWSKFDADGHPSFDENGKIAKPPTYTQPDLEGLY